MANQMGKALRFLWNLIVAPFRWLANRLFLPKQFADEVEGADKALPDVFATVVENPGELFEHLDVLRKHLFRALIGIVIMTVLSFVYTNRLIELLAVPIGGLSNMQAIGVTETIGVYMKVALLSGFILSMPYTIFELWRFIVPALKRSEYLFGLIAIPSATLLFVAGVSFAYFVMLPTGLNFLLHSVIPGVKTNPTISQYMSFVTSLLFWIGLSFEFPLLIYILAAVRLVNARMLIKQWRIAVVLIAILAAAITPTVDPINMSLVMGPLIILYFLSIGLAFIAQRGRNAEPEPSGI